jgi:8-oxo-dGDP phosphatase
MDGRWYPSNGRAVYESDWVNVELFDVELPDKSTIEHHAVTVSTGEGAGMLAHDAEKGVLLIWRHRFITDTWGWELPAGVVDEKEMPKQAALRELTEETGWKAEKANKLFTFHRMPGVLNDVTHLFHTDSVTFEGPGRDANEAADVAWMTLEQIETAIKKGEVTDAFTVTSLLYAMKFGPLSDNPDTDKPVE